MQIKDDVLGVPELTTLCSAFRYVLDKGMWGISHNMWTEDLLDRVSGTTSTLQWSGDNAEDLLKLFRPHLPQCDELTGQFNLWYPFSAIGWHNDGGYKFGATFYLNEEWSPNAGGIFLWQDSEDDDKIRGLVPKFNTLVVNDKHEPHCVTTVNAAIGEPRMTVQLWGH